MTAAIIVASGSSQRMGFDKLLADIGGKPVLQRSVEAFLAVESIEQIVVVCPGDRWSQIDIEDSRITRVDGGTTRQNSVNAGLDALGEGIDYVAIHDGARPLVSAVDIEECIVTARDFGAATLAKPATETMMRADEDGFSTKRVDREQIWFMETPQVFELEQLAKAAQYTRSANLNCTDEVSALQTVGGRVKFIEPSRPNLKITTPSDLALATALIKDAE